METDASAEESQECQECQESQECRECQDQRIRAILTPGCETHVIDRDEQLQEFIALYSGRARQRSEGWLLAKRQSIGGSELATLMGMNPYSTFSQLVAEKAGGGTKFIGAPPVWWGTTFEAVIETVVAADLGTVLRGTDINIPAPFVGHANSPDGYGVVRLAWLDGAWQVVGTSRESEALCGGLPTTEFVALVEFKCPYLRIPKIGAIPRHYRPQVWSGLALSPPADFGLFIDGCFRKCPLEVLGGRPGYDTNYHRDRSAILLDESPYAWGFIAVYAPRLGSASASCAKRSPSSSDRCPAYSAWRLWARHFGMPDYDGVSAIDFGESPAAEFDEMLEFAAAASWPTRPSRPFFADGRPRSARCDCAASFDAERRDAEGAVPAEHYLLGLVPWKLLDLQYVPVERRPGFCEEIEPLVARALELVRRARAAGEAAADDHAAGVDTFMYIHGEDAKPTKRSAPETLQAVFDFL